MHSSPCGDRHTEQTHVNVHVKDPTRDRSRQGSFNQSLKPQEWGVPPPSTRPVWAGNPRLAVLSCQTQEKSQREQGGVGSPSGLEEAPPQAHPPGPHRLCKFGCTRGHGMGKDCSGCSRAESGQTWGQHALCRGP